jgi:hypothetical protein
MYTPVAEVLIKFFREPTSMKYRPDCNIKKIYLEYADREREAVLSLLSGVLHENPFIEEFGLEATTAYSYLNVNNYIENFEDFTIGP